MSQQKEQDFWVPSGATLRLPPRMRLARAERERLWKGFERFVNCGDSETDYQALGRAFPDFWPVEIWHYPNYRAPVPPPILGRIVAPLPHDLSDEEQLKKWKHEGKMESLNWHPACRKLFLFHRDTLREVWRGERPTIRYEDDRKTTLAAFAHLSPLGWFGGPAHEFLLGLTDYNEEARDSATRDSATNGGYALNLTRPVALDSAWQDILDKFPTAAVRSRVEIRMLWGIGDFSLVPHNDFQRAFYLLFRQNWRARVCPRCKMFFVARKPKQIFCGTGCSAGNRLASKRKWWNRVGAKRRARGRQKGSKDSRRERESR
jgi:hypothetical protein